MQSRVALTAIRWSGLHRWSSSARDRTSSSQGHPVPGRASLPQQWGMKPARRAYGHIMRMLRNLWVRLRWQKVKGTLESELKRIERSTLLILDDLFLVNLDAKERPILLDIIEDRHGRKSIIITSQLPTDNWYDAIGDPTVADAIMDRIIHTAHRIELTGESVRKMAAYRGK